MDLNAARGALIEEARDLLMSMESSLLTIEDNISQDEIDALFRVAHTIKGSAGLFALDLIVNFTHQMESVLDLVRNKEIDLDEEMISLLLNCKDYLSLLINAVENSSENTDPDPTTRAQLLDQLEGYLSTASHPAPAEPQAYIEKENYKQPTDTHWHISLRFSKEIIREGMDPLSFIQYLATLGKILYIHTITSQIPPLDEADIESCYLGFEIDLESDKDKKTIEETFDFIRQDSTIRILAPHSRIQDYIDLIYSVPESPQLLGEILLKGGSITPLELNEILQIQQDGSGQPLGSLLVAENVVAAPVVAAALHKQKQSEDKKIRT